MESKRDFKNPAFYTNRELSWVRFNERVLSEARDKQIPLFERLKFLSITASNLDEFFMIRVASLKDMVNAKYKKPDIAGMTPQEQLDELNPVTHNLVTTQYSTYNRSLVPLLKQHLNIITSHEDLTEEQGKFVDENGAEKLLGRGDMLFKPIDENHSIRLQGAFLSDDDVASVVDFIKNQASADYDETFDPGEVAEDDARSFDSNGSAGTSDSGDPLFEQAKQLVIESQKASASMLQRRLSTGFNRATRIMEELEAAGIITPAEGTKPRKVLAAHLEEPAADTENGGNHDSI